MSQSVVPYAGNVQRVCDECHQPAEVAPIRPCPSCEVDLCEVCADDGCTKCEWHRGLCPYCLSRLTEGFCRDCGEFTGVV